MNTLKIALCAAACAALMAGCAKDPAKDVAKAKVEKPAPAKKAEAAKQEAAKPAAAKPAADKAGVAKAAEPAAKPAAPKPAGGIALTGTIEFVGSKVTGKHEGIFREWSGTVALKDGKAEGGSLNLVVKTGSVEADHKNPVPVWSAKLTSHLKNGDFFASEKFPEATFASDAITAKAGDKGATHEVKGKLTIRGVTKDVTFPATITAGDEVVGKAEFVINRKDFGIEYKGKPDDLIRDDVVLAINVKGQQVAKGKK